MREVVYKDAGRSVSFYHCNGDLWIHIDPGLERHLASITLGADAVELLIDDLKAMLEKMKEWEDE